MEDGESDVVFVVIVKGIMMGTQKGISMVWRKAHPKACWRVPLTVERTATLTASAPEMALQSVED